MIFIKEQNSYIGFLTVGERKYTFEMILPENDQETEPILKLDWRLKAKLGDSLLEFLKSNEFSDPKHFFTQFDLFVKSKIKKTEKPETWLQNPLKCSTLAKSIQQEIGSIGENVKNFDIATGILEMEVTDSQLRVHKAVLKLNQNYLIEPLQVVNHDLPIQKKDILQCSFNLDNTLSITEFFKNFSELINHFQNFWNTIGLIDTQCCVLDPVNPTYKDTFRRIKLSDTLSAVIMFNPFLPNQRPNIKLLGCQSEVNHYQDILQSNLENDMWDYEADLLFNLSTVLEVSIPNKIYDEDPEGLDLTGEGECAICFTWRLENEIPSEVCENTNCKLVYHSKCLFTYLSSIPRNRDYFGNIQGECPNCDHAISCTVPKLL